MSEAVSVTFKEGGEWLPFPLSAEQRRAIYDNGQRCILVHSIKFDDGRIWDAVNGWRPT